MKIETIIKSEIKGWKKAEVLWLIVACTVIAGLSIYWGDNAIGIVSSVTGVACVVCTGKGKLSAYLFGLVNCVLYSIISYKATLYGETMLNTVYYVPMQLVGFLVWSHHMDKETGEVKKRKMPLRNLLIMISGITLGTYLYGLILAHIGDAMPFVDAFTTVSSVVAMIVSIRMYAEQWWIWVAVDIFSVYMWWCDFQSGSDNMATLLMWIVYLGNAIIMLIKWEKEARKKNEI